MKLFYREFGNAGENIIIAHGLYGSSDNWVSIARQLSDRFRVIVVDLRNHGKSPHSEDHSFELMASDIKTLLIDLNIQKAYFVGHSMGGKVVMQFALSYPTMVKKIAILDVAPKSYISRKSDAINNHHAILHAMMDLNISTLKTRVEIEEYMHTTIGNNTIANFLLKNIARRNDGYYEWKLNVEALYNNLDQILDGFSQYANTEIEPFTGPTLFLRGEKSTYFEDEDLLNARKLFPNCELSTIPNAGHWLHAEQPELVAKSLIYFFD